MKLPLLISSRPAKLKEQIHVNLHLMSHIIIVQKSGLKK